MGERFKGRGHSYTWLIHVDVWQKPTKFCKAIVLQLKKKTIAEKIDQIDLCKKPPSFE